MLIKELPAILLVFAIKEGRQVNLKAPASKKKLFAVSALLLLFMLGISSTANAADSLYYPSQTPQTTYDPLKFVSPYTTVTIDVSPKVNGIPQGTEQTWTVVVTYEVTAAGDGKVNSAQARELEIIWENNLDAGYSMTTPQGGTVVGPTELTGNKWDVFVNKASGYFGEGVVFVLTFEITTPDNLAPGTYHLVKLWHRSFGDFSGQESSSDNGIVIVFDVGPSNVVPEYPWAGLAALFSCFGALVVFKKRNSLATKIRAFI
jgi:hypothetical protein